jgi:hypothetical protein
MHHVDIWQEIRNYEGLLGPLCEPSIVVGYGKPMLRIIPQVEGQGYGLTVTDMEGNVLLTADCTNWTSSGVLEPTDTITYKSRVR